MKLTLVQTRFIEIVVMNKRQTLTCTKPLKFIINALNFFMIILIIPFYYTGYYNLWNIFMIVLLYFFYQLLNFLNSIDVISNIICSTIYDNYMRFLTKFWFNIITYNNSCSTCGVIFIIFSLDIPIPVIFFIMESPMMKSFF